MSNDVERLIPKDGPSSSESSHEHEAETSRVVRIDPTVTKTVNTRRLPLDANRSFRLAPVSEPEGDDTCNDFQSLQYLIKANTGVAVLAMPCAFKYAGMYLGPAAMALVAVVAIACFNMLITSSDKLSALAGSRLDYAGIAYVAALNGPTRFFRRHAVGVKYFVNVILTFAQLGNCIAYFVFLGGTLQTLLAEHGVDVNIYYLTLSVFVPLLIFGLIRNIRFLSKFSTLINVVYVFCLVSIMVWMCENIKNPQTRPPIGPVSTIPLFFGNAIYSIEGIGSIIPLKNKTRNQGHFSYILNFGMTFVFLLLITFGFLGYAAFGEETQTSITYNLPNTPFYECVHLVLSATVLLCFSVQMYPVVQVFEPIAAKIFPNVSPTVQEYLSRTCLIIFTLVIALIVPMLTLFLDIVGAVASTALAIVFPCILYDTVVALENPEWTKYRVFIRILCSILCITGICCGAVSASLAVIDVIQALF